MKSYIIGAVFFFAVGLFIFLRRQKWLATVRQQIAAAQHWPEANARVDFAGTRNLEKTSTAILDFLVMVVLRTPISRTLTMVVDFRFEVGGQIYQGSRLAFGNLKTAPRHARDILARYPKGSVIRIRYNPRDPRDNVIVPGELVESKSTRVIGPMIMGFAFLLIIIGLTKR